MLTTHLLHASRPASITRVFTLIALLFVPAASLVADPDVDGNFLTFPGSHWWQVENAWPESGIVCDASGWNRQCLLEPGHYKWVEFLDSGSVSGMLTIEAPENEESLQMIVVEQRCLKDYWLGFFDECDGDHCIVETRYDRQEPLAETSDFISVPSDYFACRVDCPENFRVVSAEAEGGIGFDAAIAFPSRVKHFQTRGIGTSSVELLQFDFPQHEIESFVTQTLIEARAVCANF